MQLYRYFVSQSSEFCRRNNLCCFSTSVYYYCLFCYRLSLESSEYTLVFSAVTELPSHVLDMRLSGPLGRYGRSGGEQKILRQPGTEPRSSSP